MSAHIRGKRKIVEKGFAESANSSVASKLVKWYI